jgi:predicted Zn-dependent protease
MRQHRIFRCAAALCIATFFAGACSGSGQKPTKQKRTVLYTEYDDVRVGREGADEVARSIGVIEDSDLDAYVNEIGQKLLRGVPRRSFQYQFKVVDQFEPNAFALPGGYIFISRGLLVLANNEDEMANVIGHEITHAARRHAAVQQALARHSNPLSPPWTRMAELASYGRDMEREADRGGQMLAAAAGYDPMGMSTFLKSLGQMEKRSRLRPRALLLRHAPRLARACRRQRRPGTRDPLEARQESRRHAARPSEADRRRSARSEARERHLRRRALRAPGPRLPDPLPERLEDLEFRAGGGGGGTAR